MAGIAGLPEMSATERVISVTVVIEDRLIPFFRLMAFIAFITEAIRVDVSYRVTGDALFRCVLVFPLDVTGVAGHLLVGKLKLEISFVVIEAGFSPFIR
jgi:hypothetical protein